jgi:acetyl-CoA carboxylase carboxyltransferase component
LDKKLVDAIYEARAAAYDTGRPEAVARVHATRHLTARERITALLDVGSEVEFGILQGRDGERWAHTLGGVDFVGAVDGQPVIASSTDYSHHGGGYGAGYMARLFALAKQHRWPIVLFVDGGGSQARRLDSARSSVQGLRGRYEGTIGFFEALLELGGWVPTVAVVSGPSYAGHASLAASCDVIVSTRGSTIGMGGPPMVEAAFGLKVTPAELGPVEMHEAIGGIDLLVDDEPAALRAVRTYLSYNHDRPSGEASATAGTIPSLVPDEGPYDMHLVIDALVDADSFLELRPNFAVSLITGFARMDGRAVGILANQPASPDGGAIDQNAANKIARFVQLCDAYALPMISLVDTPGFVVKLTGEGEGSRPGLTRHHARPIRAMHHRTVPLFTVQMRKAYGLAVGAMSGVGRTHSLPILRLAWPTVELGVQDQYGGGLDDVIDPVETRDRILRMLRLTTRPPANERPRRVRDVW